MASPSLVLTGATGFLGRHLVSSLQDSAYQVQAISRSPKTSQGQVHYLQADLEQLATLEAIRPDIQDAEILVDLAALIPKSGQQAGFEAFYEANVNSHIRLLEQLPALKKVVYASTIDVYGPMGAAAHHEGLLPQPTNTYGLTKLWMEQYYQQYCRAKGIDLTILRFTQLYGPGDPIIKVIPIFIDRILKKKPLTLKGTGEDLRCYLYVADAVQAIELALTSSKTGIFNVAGEQLTSMNDLVACLEKISPYPIEIERIAGAPPRHYYMDASKIRANWGFQQRYLLEDGLTETLQSYVGSI